MRAGMKKWMLFLLTTIGVIIIFQICYGLGVMWPSNINWLMTARHDWGTHYLGWAFYKNESWHFPLGKVLGYNYPVGTNVGFTDSIPLLAIFFKLFAPLLPEDFQYFGVWLFSCHLLAAYFTVLLFRRFKVSAVITLAAAIFIAANPVLIHRGMHPALCAQWMFIACIYFYFLDTRMTRPDKILGYQFILLLLSALINPYLCLMVTGFTFATPARLCFIDKVIKKKKFVIYILASVISAAFLWYITGMISFGRKEDLGVGGAYGLYTMNLNSLYNAGGFAALTHSFDWVSWHQYEGFMYLGAGILLLIVILFVVSVLGFIKTRHKTADLPDRKGLRDKTLIPLWILVALFAIFSITGVISFNNRVILRIPAPAIFIHLVEVFRACGRFFWVPYYLIILFTIMAIAKSRFSQWVTTFLIVVALAIQLYDIKLLLTYRHLSHGTYTAPMDNPDWISIMKQFNEILFFPAFQPPGIRAMDYQDFSYLALKAGRPVNLAYVARGDSRAARIFNDSLNRMVENDSLSPQALYITNLVNLDHFAPALQSGSARLTMLDSCYYIYSSALKNKMLDSLSAKLNDRDKAGMDSLLKALQTKREFFESGDVPQANQKSIRYWLESLNVGKDVISMSGWAFVDTTQNNKGDSIFITLTSAEKSYWVQTRQVQRPDLGSAFNRIYLGDAGFNFFAFTDSVKPGQYKLGMVIKDSKGKLVYDPKLSRGDVTEEEYIKK
jgi:hypothetical protein